MKSMIAFGMVALLLVTGFIRAEEPAAEVIVDATDKAALEANLNKNVTVSGTVSLAEWSRSGKVLNIEFTGTEESRLIAAAFAAKRKELDDAFAGDFAVAIAGAKVKITGKLKTYGGKAKQFEGAPQIIIDAPSQVTIVESAAPSTQPSGK